MAVRAVKNHGTGVLSGPVPLYARVLHHPNLLQNLVVR